MKCENVFCIYQENGACNNENEINIDWRGLCKNMIPVKTTRYTLDIEKMITKLNMKDKKHFFDKESGRVIMTDEVFAFFDSKFKLE